MKAVKSTSMLVVGIGAGLVAALGSTAVQARRGYAKPYYSQTYDFDKPVRGYEGGVALDYYCSYKSYPKRVCSTNSRGR